MTDGAVPPPPGLPASPARRRALALGVLATMVATIGFGVVLPAIEALTEAAEQEAADRTLLARLARVEAEAPMLRRQIDAIDRELAAAAAVLRAPSPGQAAAELQAVARTLLGAAGVQLTSAQALPPVPQGTLTRIGLRIEFRADIVALAAIVAAIEAHRPRLFVRDALIAAPVAGRGTADGGALTLRLDIAALAQLENGRGA